jgi:hypothetical protein
MTIRKRLLVALAAVCLLGLAAPSTRQSAQASVETTRAANGATVTKIKMNGQFVFTFLNADPFSGSLTASRDQIANTSALDFAYVLPTTTENVFLFVEGAGAIPNSALVMTSTSAHLSVTSFPVIECLVNAETGVSTCAEGSPRSFDLTWVKNGLGSRYEKTTRRDTFGPVTTRFSGEFVSETADVSGTWDTRDASGFSGDIMDTRNKTIIREITVAPTQ